MALPSEVTTRVDQLHADLRRIHVAHAKRVALPDNAPMFTVHSDGSVWNRQGVQLRAPVQAKK